MYAKIKFDDKKAQELYERAQNALKEFNQCYFELRELGVVEFQEEHKENPDSSN